MARYHVQTAQLREISRRLTDAAHAAFDLVDHPGVVRGRAADGDDPVLRDAAELFAQRWHHGLGLMGADTRRLADVLRLAAHTYERADAALSSAWTTRQIGRR